MASHPPREESPNQYRGSDYRILSQAVFAVNQLTIKVALMTVDSKGGGKEPTVEQGERTIVTIIFMRNMTGIKYHSDRHSLFGYEQ